MPRWEPDFDPRFDLRSPDLLGLIVQIEAYRLSVPKIPLPPKMQEQMNRLNIIRQVKGTTGIEGNTLTPERIGQVLEGTSGSSSGPAQDELEVINAERTLKFIRKTARESGALVTEDLVRKLHDIGTTGCEYKDNIPGQYRKHNVTAGEYHPPEPAEIPRLMKRYVDFINSDEVIRGYGPLIRAILAHFYLVSIHPFGDGNGRTSRAVEAFVLFQAGYNVRGFYSLANFYYQHRQQYIDLLQATRFENRGDLTQFVRFSLTGFLEELKAIQEEIIDYVRRVLFRDMCLELYNNDVINARGMSLLEYLTFDVTEGVPYDAFKNRTHRLARGLYQGLTEKTVLRDIRNLQARKLLSLKDGVLTANLDIMNQFEA